MSSLKTCTSCSGFIPGQASTCPNCDTVAPGSLLLSGPMRRIGGALIGGAMAITLSACYGSPIECCADPVTCQPGEVDADDDGFCGEFDCDDDNPEINTWADDIPGDGIDQDCSGEDA